MENINLILSVFYLKKTNKQFSSFHFGIIQIHFQKELMVYIIYVGKRVTVIAQHPRYEKHMVIKQK